MPCIIDRLYLQIQCKGFFRHVFFKADNKHIIVCLGQEFIFIIKEGLCYKIDSLQVRTAVGPIFDIVGPIQVRCDEFYGRSPSILERVGFP